MQHLTFFCVPLLALWTTCVHATSRDTVLSLFNLKEKNNLWDPDILLESIDELRRPPKFYAGINEIDHFVSQGNLASYLGLHPIQAVYLPVPVNFLFIGFNGEGNHGIKLTEQQLQRWFRHMDHVQERTVMPKGWSNAHWQQQGEGEEDEDAEEITFQHSHVRFNYTVHAIEMGSRVLSVFEDAIHALSRRADPEDPSPDESAPFQVDMEGMGHLIDSLLDFLQLPSSAYNIIVMNPTRKRTRNKYGYRIGLSDEEFGLIQKNPKKKRSLLSPLLEKFPKLLEADHIPSPLFYRRPGHKFVWKDIEPHETIQWTTRYEGLVASVERLINERTDPVENAFRKAQQMLTGSSPRRRSTLRRAIKEGTASSSSSSASPSEEQCLVDTWISQHRWALLDLTAGPFSWGPDVGPQGGGGGGAEWWQPAEFGGGHRTHTSLPSVDTHFKDIQLGQQAKEADAEMEVDLQHMREERMESVADNAGHEVELLMAELDVYEAFAAKHCRGSRRRSPLCLELRARVEDMKEELSRQDKEAAEGSFEGEHARKGLQRLHAWSFMKEMAESADNATSPEESNAWDSLLSRLSSTLSSAMRHVVTPTAHSSPAHFYPKVSFHVYLVHQQLNFDRRKTPGFVEDLKADLASLLLPNQQYQFTLHRLSLYDDPALSTAYASSLRTSLLSLPSSDGSSNSSSSSVPQWFLDSRQLQQQLHAQKGQEGKTQHDAHRSLLELPIFIFSLTEDHPVVIDEHAVAKATEHGVLAVQLAHSHWPTGFRCNGKEQHADLRNPTKPIVAAVLQFLGGVLPPHLHFSTAHGTLFEDWTWSVGDSPLSHTAHDGPVSSFQRDSMARNYVATAIDESVKAVNSALEELQQQHTISKVFHSFKRSERELVARYNHIVSLWQQIAGHMEEQKFEEATGLLQPLEHESNEFHSFVHDLILSLHSLRCARSHRIFHLRALPLTFLLSLLLLLLLCLVLRPRRSKPKVN